MSSRRRHDLSGSAGLRLKKVKVTWSFLFIGVPTAAGTPRPYSSYRECPLAWIIRLIRRESLR